MYLLLFFLSCLTPFLSLCHSVILSPAQEDYSKKEKLRYKCTRYNIGDANSHVFNFHFAEDTLLVFSAAATFKETQREMKEKINK